MHSSLFSFVKSHFFDWEMTIMKWFICITGCLVYFQATAQVLPNQLNIQPAEAFENVFVQRLQGDSNYTAFVIWIRYEVKPHYHQHHTEVITVLDGKANMTLNGEQFKIKKGDVLVIPEKSVHSVINKHKKPLKVLSVQTPWFDGTDRIMK